MSSIGKKFGAFSGVFLPSLLTILGVIMYMRLGWVVGQAGLIGAVAIIFLAHVISITTGLSVSSIATDRKIKAGGIYYMLSRSLGLPIGGSIGLTIFVGTCLSISLYLIGFAESFNQAFNLGTTINDYRITGTAALTGLTIVAMISTNLALRMQYLILLAIALSLVSIFAATGTATGPPPLFFEGSTSDFATVFAIFFPAVTGFTAGIAMSGDLKDPAKAIPKGTMLSIGVGLIIYLILTVFIAYTFHPDALKLDNNLLMQKAWIPILVMAGIWGATLSSALGGILGGPRIMQAIARDKIAHKKLAEGVGESNEPRNALILSFFIAEAGILIGELDAIARIVSMFYLSAYGFINLSAALENWSSSEFRPSFRVPTWVSVLGFIATFFIMMQLDPLAMLLAILIMGGIFFLLRRKQMAIGSGSIWMNVWNNLVRAGIKLIDVESVHKRNWQPNILALTVGEKQKREIREFGADLAGSYGMITHIEVLEDKSQPYIFPEKPVRIDDSDLVSRGIFARSLHSSKPYEAIDALISTFGFPGVEPNTILLPLELVLREAEKGYQLVAQATNLDHNLILLDPHPIRAFGKKKQIDIWWRGLSNNGELMLQIIKFLQVSGDWRQADFRLIMIGNASKRKKRRYTAQKAMIQRVLDHFRLKGEISIIDNTDPPKPVQALIAETSREADLVILGLADTAQMDSQSYVAQVKDITEKIDASVILVKASSFFESREIDLEQEQDLDEKVIKIDN